MVLLGVPSVAFGGSFASSLIQGKTPAEAAEVIAEQVGVLFGRVQELETEQAKSAEDIELLKEENEQLRGALEGKADIKVDPTKTPECLALSAQIETAENKNDDLIGALSDKIRPLKQQLVDVRRGSVSGATVDESNDMAAYQKRISEIKAQETSLKQQIATLEAQIDPLQTQAESAAAPLLEKAFSRGCLKG